MLILCPATLCQQWQVELKDRLGIPSAVWLSDRKLWQDADGNLIKSNGAEAIGRCPYRIGIVCTGLIFQRHAERAELLRRSFGTLVLDEAHRARRGRGYRRQGRRGQQPAQLHDRSGGATPGMCCSAPRRRSRPTRPSSGICSTSCAGAPSTCSATVGAAGGSRRAVLPLVTGAEAGRRRSRGLGTDAQPAAARPRGPAVRSDPRRSGRRPTGVLHLATRGRAWISSPATSCPDRLQDDERGTGFFQRHNPIVRHTILRKRATLEQLGLLERIAVDIWPMAGDALPMFEGQALLTSHEIDEACQAAEDFTKALAQRKRGTGFMKGLILQRICSSLASWARHGAAPAREAAGDRDDDERARPGARIGRVRRTERAALERHRRLCWPTGPPIPSWKPFSFSWSSATGSISAASCSASTTTRLRGSPGR